LDIEAVINDLRRAEAPSRQLDRAIAELVGWKRVVQPAANQAGTGKGNTVWLAPTDGAPATVPFYTSNLEDAYRLAQMVAPSVEGGCSWDGAGGYAQIDLSSPKIQAPSPSIALTIAALLRMRRAAR
jgi:hypothetical protein